MSCERNPDRSQFFVKDVESPIHFACFWGRRLLSDEKYYLTFRG